MVNTVIARLLDVANSALSPAPALMAVKNAGCDRQIIADWCGLLAVRNGFYSFESALHVFPSRSNARHFGLDEWNSRDLWRREYARLMDEDMLFVAEDVFGNQFGLIEDFVCRFDAETAAVTMFSRSVAEWSERMLTEFNLHTGYPVAHEWQSLYGGIAPGWRLLPKAPFVPGGNPLAENFYECEVVTGMRMRGHRARQLADAPNGARSNAQSAVVD
jgi:hypothetical protein